MKVPEKKVYDVAESEYQLTYDYGCVTNLAKRFQLSQKSVRGALKGKTDFVSKNNYILARLAAIKDYNAYPIVVKAVKL